MSELAVAFALGLAAGLIVGFWRGYEKGKTARLARELIDAIRRSFP